MNVLCRHAPTWIGTLERPSPMHLAEAIVLDHPDSTRPATPRGKPSKAVNEFKGGQERLFEFP